MSLANTRAQQMMTGTSDNELAKFLSDPENLNKFIGVAITESIGYVLTDKKEWAIIEE